MRLQIERMGKQLQMEIHESDIIGFDQGIVGFESIAEYALLTDPDGGIQWLHAINGENVAFTVIDPFLVWPEYDVQIADGDTIALKLTRPEDAQLLAIVTPREDPAEITANLMAPLVINRAAQLGRQVILQNSLYPLRAQILSELGQQVVGPAQTTAQSSPASQQASQQRLATSSETDQSQEQRRAA